MSQLTQAIKFRILADELDDDEFHRYITSLLQSDGKQLLLRSLFSEFIKPNNNDGMKTVIKSNQIISNIIESRNIKHRKHLNNNRTICSLSNELIGELAAYLQQSDYISFSQSNRCIYYAANNPNKLLHLNLLRVSDYSSINLRKYRAIQKLEVCVHQLDQLTFPQRKMNNLRA